MTKKKLRYETRVFDGRIIHSVEIERIHREVLDFERIEAISDPMRELIEDLWPELVTKLPPKRPPAADRKSHPVRSDRGRTDHWPDHAVQLSPKP
jgi:hypothetical protein